MSHGDDSSDDETISAGEQAARVLQSHFDCGEDDLRLVGGIPTKTQSRRWRSIEMASISTKSRTVSSGASSQHMPAVGRRASRGVM